MTIQVTSNEPKVETPATPAATAEVKTDVHSENASAPVEQTEQNETATSEAAETEEVVSEEKTEHEEATGAESEKSDTAEATQQGQDKPGKKKSGFQKRIDKLNQAKAEAQREAEFWRQQALKNANEPKTEQVEPKKPVATDGKPMPENFETHAEYVEAIADWKAEQKLKEREEKAEKTRVESEQAKKVQTYLDKKAAFAEKTPDFDDVLDEVSDIRVSPTVSQLIIESEHGPELAYELAKNREEYARIVKLPPLAAAREMGKLEARIASKTSEAKETKKTTNAPKPLAPVGSGKGAAPKSITDPNLSYAEYKRLREQELKKKRA